MFRKRAFMLFVLIITSFTLMTGGCGSDSPEYPFSTFAGTWIAVNGWWDENNEAGEGYSFKATLDSGGAIITVSDITDAGGEITILPSSFIFDTNDSPSSYRESRPMNGELTLARTGKNQYEVQDTGDAKIIFKILSPNSFLISANVTYSSGYSNFEFTLVRKDSNAHNPPEFDDPGVLAGYWSQGNGFGTATDETGRVFGLDMSWYSSFGFLPVGGNNSLMSANSAYFDWDILRQNGTTIGLHNWSDANVPLTSTGKNQFEFTYDGGTFKITIISDILIMVNETGKFTEGSTGYDYDVTYFLMKGAIPM